MDFKMDVRQLTKFFPPGMASEIFLDHVFRFPLFLPPTSLGILSLQGNLISLGENISIHENEIYGYMSKQLFVNS